MTTPFYMLFAMLTVGGYGMLTYRGFSFDKYQEIKDVPKSVRNNPGAYRPHYYDSPRYTGGK